MSTSTLMLLLLGILLGTGLSLLAAYLGFLTSKRKAKKDNQVFNAARRVFLDSGEYYLARIVIDKKEGIAWISCTKEVVWDRYKVPLGDVDWENSTWHDFLLCECEKIQSGPNPGDKPPIDLFKGEE